MIEKADGAKKPFRLIDMLRATGDRLKAEGDELRDLETRSLGDQQAMESIADRRRLLCIDLRDLRGSLEHLRRAELANSAAAH